jgi:hypothetical protein
MTRFVTVMLCDCAVRGLVQCLHLFAQLRRTWWADTMARIARHRGILALPTDAPLTPGTFHQQITLAQRREVLMEFSVFCLKIERPFAQLVDPPWHSGTQHTPLGVSPANCAMTSLPPMSIWADFPRSSARCAALMSGSSTVMRRGAIDHLVRCHDVRASEMMYVPKIPDACCREIAGTILKLWLFMPGRRATGLRGAGGALAVFTRGDPGTARRGGRGVGTAPCGRPAGWSPCVYGSGT